MTQEQQDKQAFFGCYINQKYSRNITYLNGEIETVGPYEVTDRLSNLDFIDYFDPGYESISHVDDYVLLTPLSMITDEHAIEVARMTWSDTEGGRKFWTAEDGRNEIHLRTIHGGAEYLPQKYVDYLRLRGYLLPFRQYTTQQLLDMGWAKLKSA